MMLARDYSWKRFIQAIGTVMVIVVGASVIGAPLMTHKAQQHRERLVDVGVFNRIQLVGAASIEIKQTGRGSVRITGAPQIMDELVIESSDGVLYIETNNQQGADELVIHLSVDELREIVSVGAAKIRASNLEAPELSLDGNGTGQFDIRDMRVDELFVVGAGETDFELSGQVKRQVIDMDGQGSYEGSLLASQTSEVNVRGGGDVDLWVERMLDVNIVGSGSVEYAGAPLVLQQVFGTGVVGRAHAR